MGLNRASYYYQPVGESDLNLELMHKIDQIYTEMPFYGWPRMTAQLKREGYDINHKRVRRLMQKMGLQALYPRAKVKKSGEEHRIYPYLLRKCFKGVCLELRKPENIMSIERRSQSKPPKIRDWVARIAKKSLKAK